VREVVGTVLGHGGQTLPQGSSGTTLLHGRGL
jgi:hypothetical protein